MGNEGDPNLAAPELESPQMDQAPTPINETVPMTATTQRGETSLESINVFTQMGLIPDLFLFLVLGVALLAGCNWLFRRAVEKEEGPAGPFAMWNIVFCLGLGLLAFFILAPHTGENAADFGDLLGKVNWLFVAFGACLVGFGCVISTWNKADNLDLELN